MISKCFKKVRVSDKHNKKIEELFRRRNYLRGKSDENSKALLEQVEKELAEKCAKENYEKIMEEISGIKSDEGGFHPGSLWKLKKKLNPKCRDPPTAMVDTDGNLATTNKNIEVIALDAYKKRLENRPIKEGLENFQKEKED